MSSAKARQSHPITESDLEQWIGNAMETLQNIQFQGKPQDIQDILKQTTQKEPYWALPEEVQLAFAIRLATCLFFYFVDLLNERTGLREELSGNAGNINIGAKKKMRFNSAYSLFVMGRSIATRCNKFLKKKEVEADRLDLSYEPVVGMGFKRDLSWAVNDYVRVLKATDDVATLLSATHDYWQYLANRMAEVCKETPDLLALVEGTTFHHNKFVICGLKTEYRQATQNVLAWKPVEPHHVVGDQHVTVNLIRQCDRLALYDIGAEKNPFCEFGGLVESILLDGPPGTGKTTRQQMMLTRLAKRSEQLATPYVSKSLTADQIKTEWYGRTAQLINELLSSVQSPDKISLLFVDDIDLLLTGDRGSAGANGADLDIMKALMDFFSGIGTNYKGNYLALAATNKPTATDEALRQRFVYRALIYGPNTAEDFADLTAHELFDFGKTGLLKINTGSYQPLSRPLSSKNKEGLGKDLLAKHTGKSKTWDDIGQFCAELRSQDSRFTGRSVRNAIKLAIAESSDFDVPEEWFDDPQKFHLRPWEEKVDLVRELYKPLTANQVMAALEHQFTVEQRYRQEALDKRVADLRDEILIRETAINKNNDAPV